MAKHKRARALPFLALALIVAARIIAGSALAGDVRPLFAGVPAWKIALAVGAALIALALAARAFVLPRLRDVPRGAQGALEALAAMALVIARFARKIGRGFLKAGAKMKAIFKSKITARVLLAAAICAALGVALGRIFPHGGGHELSVSMGAPPVNFFGREIASSVVFTWYIMAALFVLAVFVRVALVPRMSDSPRGLQNAMETVIEACESFTKSHVHGVSAALPAYIFAVGCYLVASASIELVGLRPPTSDVTVTFALSGVTFVLINYYGLKVKGLKGRAKQFVRPRAFMVPFKLLSDMSIPISLACRLFGNMLGGMIVMNLLYMALGSFAVGIPAVLGLYFNLFHPLIQTFIFMKLSLSFIEEAVD